MATNERFKRLYSLPAQLYRQGSPVLIDAGALLLDQQTGRTLVQLRLTNVSQNTLTGVKIALECLDMEGLTLGTVEASYPDLTLKPGQSTGDRVPVYLPHANARSLRLWVTTAVDAEHQVWKAPGKEPFQPLPQALQPDMPSGLLAQYREELKTAHHNLSGECALQEAQGLWQCGCKGWNPADAESCLHCGLSLAWQKEHQEPEALQQRMEVRQQQLAEEARRKAEEQKRKAEEEKRRAEELRLAQEAEEEKRQAAIRKYSIIGGFAVALLAIILLITKVIIPNNIRKEGLALVEAGQYSQARLVYNQLANGYDEYCEAVDEHGDAMLRAAEYDKAIEAYGAIAKISDINNAKMKKIGALKAADDYPAAMDVFNTMSMSETSGNKRTYQDEKNDFLLEWALKLADEGNYAEALAKVDLCSYTNARSTTRTAQTETRTAIYVAQGDQLMTEECFTAASEAYDKANARYRASYARGRAYEAAGRYGLAAKEYGNSTGSSDLPDAEERYKNAKEKSLVNPKVGDVVYFGSKNNGNIALTWQVLAIDGDTALLQCLTSLYSGPIMSKYGEKMDWVNSPVRTQLNNTYLNSCFTPEEQCLIQFSSLQNDSGTTTRDQLFLLSRLEVAQYLPTQEKRKAIGTGWWTRSAAKSDDAWRICYGDFNETFTNYSSGDIQPAMRVLYLQSADETIADAAARVMKPTYDMAVRQMNEGAFDDAIKTFTSVATYQDAQQLIYQCYELKGDQLLTEERYAAASTAYIHSNNTGKYYYAMGMQSLTAGNPSAAVANFHKAGDTMDAQKLLYLCQLKVLTNAKAGDSIALGAVDKPITISQDGNLLVVSYFDESNNKASIKIEMPPEGVNADGSLPTEEQVRAWLNEADPTLLPKDQLQWEVVYVKDNQALLLAKQPVAQMPFHEEWMEISWKDCTLRAWLNNDFLPAAFNGNEQKLLMPNQTAEGAEDLIFLPHKPMTVEEQTMLMIESGEALPDTEYIDGRPLDDYLVEAFADVDPEDQERLLTLTPGPSGDYVQSLMLSSIRYSYYRYEYSPLYVNMPAGVYPMILVRTDMEDEYTQQLKLESDYDAAMTHLNNGEFLAAEEIFLSLGDYLDSAEQAAFARQQQNAADYANAAALLGSGSYLEAEAAFLALGDYEDSAAQAVNARAQQNAADFAAAEALMEAGDYLAAEAAFLALGDYAASADRAVDARAQQNAADFAAAEALMEAGDYLAAEAAFLALGDYAASADRAVDARAQQNAMDYAAAEALLNAGSYAEAEAAFLALGDYSDSADRAAEAYDIPRRAAYNGALELFNAGQYAEAEAAFLALGDYEDSAAQAKLAHDTPLAAKYAEAEEAFAAGDYENAQQLYLAIASYTDAGKKASFIASTLSNYRQYEVTYTLAYELEQAGVYSLAYEKFLKLGDYKNSLIHAAVCLVNAGEFDWLSAPKDGAFLYSKDGKLGYVNVETGLMLYGTLGEATNEEWHESGRVIIKDGGNFGILATDGTIVTPMEWSHITLLEDGTATVLSHDGQGALNPDGSVCIPDENQRIQRVSDTVWMTSQWLYVGGERVYQRPNPDASLPLVSPQGNFVWPCDDGKWRFISSQGEVLYTSDVPLGSGTYGNTVVYQDVETKKWGMLDVETGNVLLKPTYPGGNINVNPFNNDGVMSISYQDSSKNWRHCLLNHKGEKVYSHKSYLQPSNDFFKATTGAHNYELINFAGKTVASKEQYSAIDTYPSGYMVAEGKEKSSSNYTASMVYLLDKNGKQIWKEQAVWMTMEQELPNVGLYYSNSRVNMLYVDEEGGTHQVNLYESGLRGYTITPATVDYLPDDYLLVVAHPLSEKGGSYVHSFISLKHYDAAGASATYGNIVVMGDNGVGAGYKNKLWQPVRFNGVAFVPYFYTAEDLRGEPVSITFPEYLLPKTDQ